MDETYGTYVDDECFDNHDYNDDTDHDTDDDTDDEINDDPNYDTDDDTDDGGRGTGISYLFRNTFCGTGIIYKFRGAAIYGSLVWA